MEKDILFGISGDAGRMFISVAFGCDYCCSYCYLEKMGIEEVKYRFTFNEIVHELKKKKFVRGKNGTIVSFGCFSECLAAKNKKTTLELIGFFLQQGNYVQLSTKMQLTDKDAMKIEKDIQFKNQMSILVSIPTISRSYDYEPIVDNVFERQKNLKLKQKYSFNTVIYIKPVIPGITICDAEKYIELLRENEVSVIVGEMLKPSNTKEDEEILIGNRWMKSIECDEQKELLNILKKHTTVYEHSTDIIIEERMKRGIEKKDGIKNT